MCRWSRRGQLDRDRRCTVLPLGRSPRSDAMLVNTGDPTRVPGPGCGSRHRDRTRRGYGGSSSGMTNERNLAMCEDNVRFVILLIMGIVVAVAVFFYFVFMSELHIG